MFLKASMADKNEIRANFHPCAMLTYLASSFRKYIQLKHQVSPQKLNYMFRIHNTSSNEIYSWERVYWTNSELKTFCGLCGIHK